MRASPALFRPGVFGSVAAIVAWSFLVLAPFGFLVVDLITTSSDLTQIARAQFSFRTIDLLVKSLALAGAVSLVGTCLAIVVARWARDTPHRRLHLLAWVPMLLVLVPPYVHATAWMDLGAALGRGLGLLGMQAPVLPGWLSVFWVELAALFPVSLAFALAGVAMSDPRQIEAARVFATDWAVFRHVELAQILPAVGIGSALSFILCITDFSVPALMQVEVYALEIFVEYSIAADGLVAFIVAAPITLICLGLILTVAAPVRTLAVALGPSRADRAQLMTKSSPWGLTSLALVFAVLQVGVPVVMLSIASFPFSVMWISIAENTGVILHSLRTATLSASISVLLAWVLVLRLTSSVRLMLVLLPLAVPAALTGIGAIQLWTLPGLGTLYNTSAMPVLVAVARFAPVAVLALFVQAHRYDHSLLDAARVFRGDGPAVWLGIMVPLWAPGFIVGFFAVFGLTLAELTATHLVAPPGQQTLTAKIFGLLHYGASAQVSALSLFVLLISMVLMAAIFITTKVNRFQEPGTRR